MEELKKITEEIRQNKDVEKEITPRTLFNAFNCYRRTPNNCKVVDKYLLDNNLEVEPGYNEVWIDTPIKLKHKQIATTKSFKNPIKKVQVLQSANRPPHCVSNNDSLDRAISIMRLNNYSQLPVTNNGTRGLCGYISWETIGAAVADGVSSGVVKDYKKENVKEIGLDYPLLDAIKIVYENDFVVVLGGDKSLSGIITTTDISSQFLTLTEPFFLLEEIELSIRTLMNGVFLLEDIKSICKDSETREIHSIDDLTFGEYLYLLGDDNRWSQLALKFDKRVFLENLEKVRQIRNDIMHFEPEGITKDQYKILKSTSCCLREILSNYSKRKV